MFGIYEISKLLSAPLRLESVLTSVANVLSSFLQMRYSIIVILNDDGVPDIAATSGGARETKGKPIHNMPRIIIDRLVATRTPIVIENIASEPMFRGVAEQITENANGRVSFIAVPIKADDRVVGTLSIDRVWDGAARFRLDEDVRFLTMVANLIGQTVRLHRVLSADRQRLIDEKRSVEKALNQELSDKGSLPPPKTVGIVGESDALRKVMDKVTVAARSNSTILLRGESGTGKELFARAIHDLSQRRDKPFIRLNCAALPETVLESELFGHEKGSFTGALVQRIGRFELAHGGTLLLDEIGEISGSFQAKLLRVLQEGEFERVGGTKTLKVDVRLVCATNRNLEQAVSKGEFRADLYYRINVVPLFLPPLRERRSDIRLLAEAFLKRFNAENGREMTFSDPAVGLLEHCYFPGNVRELENCVRRTATLAQHPQIESGDFSCASGECLSALLWTGGASGEATNAVAPRAEARPAAPIPLTPMAAMPPAVASSSHACDQAGNRACPIDSQVGEKQRLVDAMERAGWVQAKAARILGITPRQIGYALKKQGIELKRF
jgi:Nif-specific regulatory protein